MTPIHPISIIHPVTLSPASEIYKDYLVVMDHILESRHLQKKYDFSNQGLAIFDYIIEELPQSFKVSEIPFVQLLPSEAEIEDLGFSLSSQSRPNGSSLFLRKEAPLYIRNSEDLVILRGSLVDRIFKILQRSESYQRQNP